MLIFWRFLVDYILYSLTHWGRDKMAAIFPTTFSNAFSWKKMFEFRLKFHWSLFPRVQLTIFQHWFRLWFGAEQATSHYLNQCWLEYRRIYASLGLNELTNMTLNPMGHYVSRTEYILKKWKIKCLWWSIFCQIIVGRLVVTEDSSGKFF